MQERKKQEERKNPKDLARLASNNKALKALNVKQLARKLEYEKRA